MKKHFTLEHFLATLMVVAVIFLSRPIVSHANETVTGERSTSFAHNVSTSVTNSATLLLASNPARHGFIVVNNGTSQAVYIGPSTVVSGASAQANGGIYLAPSGGAMTSGQMDGFAGAIYGVTASSTSVVGVLEW